ncbi:uncharacterized protein BXZ73DRAFT_83688 [Epithele typhae]|uniref:uncharacterized protein n=1 Tax=Epithele typhae TaxID=378194 RepID=UPI002007F497|nr:uncharacterized protein BXZ73DRAFT_83688 [Epithele typhae]KAH9910342.1 hypothetical protein BXZ73DRAFT_83688 [Epithele typhae]
MYASPVSLGSSTRARLQTTRHKEREIDGGDTPLEKQAETQHASQTDYPAGDSLIPCGNAASPHIKQNDLFKAQRTYRLGRKPRLNDVVPDKGSRASDGDYSVRAAVKVADFSMGRTFAMTSVVVSVFVMSVRAGDAIEDRVLIGLTQSTPFDADPQNVDIHTIVVTRRVQRTLLYECDPEPHPRRAPAVARARGGPDAADGVRDGHAPWSLRSAASEGSQRGRRARSSRRRRRTCVRGRPRLWVRSVGGPVEEQVEEPERRATKEATPTRGHKTLGGDKRLGRSSTRKGAKRKSLGEESDDEGYGDAASLPPQTQEQEDSEGESRVAKRPRTERSEISVAEVEGMD